MSIYIPSARQDIPGSAQSLADSLIDMVEGFVAHAPGQVCIATRSSDLTEHKTAGLISLPMGMENGAPIHSVADLEHYYARGIRYITLTHGRDNQLCDSSYDSTRTWNGLSPLGEEVVDHMNRLGHDHRYLPSDRQHYIPSSASQQCTRTCNPLFCPAFYAGLGA